MCQMCDKFEEKNKGLRVPKSKPILKYVIITLWGCQIVLNCQFIDIFLFLYITLYIKKNHMS